MDGEQRGEPSGPTPARWTGAEVFFFFVAWFLAATAWRRLVYYLLLASGFYAQLYGHEAVALVGNPVPTGLEAAAVVAAPLTLPAPGAPSVAVVSSLAPTAGVTALVSLSELLFYRMMLWSGCLAFPLQVATLLVLVRAISGVTPADLGLTLRHAGRSAALGVVAALVVTPALLGINLLVTYLWKLWRDTGVQDHPFTRLGQLPLYPMEWVLLVFSATVVAPVWEELLFRGILQPWFVSRRHGGAIALACAFFYALVACSERIGTAVYQGPAALFEESLPALAVLLLVPVYLVLERLSKALVAPALFGTAALFAWIHAPVWPTPVALLFLGLVLGYLAYRTRSLVAPIALHAAFNGTACVFLLLQRRVGS